ncbi:MAG: CBS domain-containing protein [Hyphomicrobiales bacterium]
MNVAGILKEKGNAVETVKPDTLLSEAANTLAEMRIGALVVTDDNGAIAGILSERDMVRAVSTRGAACLTCTASEFMTSPVVTCGTQESVAGLMEIMTANKFRHLPVVEDGELLGIVSIGDVVKRRIAEAEFEAEEMKRYIASN